MRLGNGRGVEVSFDDPFDDLYMGLSFGDSYTRIIQDLVDLMQKSESDLVRKVEQNLTFSDDSQDYAEFMEERKGEFVEGMAGLCFILFQNRIRLVVRLTEGYYSQLAEIFRLHGQAEPKMTKEDMQRIEGVYQGTCFSFVQFLWEAANFYKHRDEWLDKAWNDEPLSERDKHLKAPLQKYESALPTRA